MYGVSEKKTGTLLIYSLNVYNNKCNVLFLYIGGLDDLKSYLLVMSLNIKSITFEVRAPDTAVDGQVPVPRISSTMV